ncbi:MAG: thioredoxin [Candidatus Omnitrophica bacterium]|nr:thioredoxin [Candidatus Omnitrophota bacterium]MCF7895075.1 thioredoxin [Candidatus Omnitrophota bacterium]
MAVEITNANFDSEVLNSEIPVLIDFWAPWCGPCKAVAPVLEEIEKEIGEKVKVCKVNLDEAPEIATRYSIMSIPTLMIVKDGNIMDTKVGALAKEELLKHLNQYL